MDTYAGNNQDPITLHKYIYGNADPVTYTDPTGNFSLGSMGAAMSVAGSLSTAALSGYDIGTVLYGHYTGDDPISIDQASAKQLAFATLFSVGGGKILKSLSKSKKFKKLLKLRTLYRGVSSEHRDASVYASAKLGFVPGGVRGLFLGKEARDSAAKSHNNEEEFNTPFSSWTPRRRVAKDFATHDGITSGVIIKAKIMSFRIFKSPNRFSEAEFLVVGPVWGRPSFVK